MAGRGWIAVHLFKTNQTMENQNKPNYTADPAPYRESRNSGRIFGGLLIVTIGILLLVREMGVYFPHWLFSWEMLLIAIGFYIGLRHSFSGFIWLILILIGSVFLLDDILPYMDIEDYAWPIIIISVGLFMIFRPRRKPNESLFKNWEANPKTGTSDDYIDSVTVFGGMKKNIISKDFKGGELTTFFGGSELNLMQADVEHKIVLEVTQIFGGTKLIVPPNWRVHSEELVSIFGGVDDKRPVQAGTPQENQRVLVLKGTCLFGGIDIKSY